MSFKEVPSDVVEMLASCAAQIGAGGFHITPIRICDHCQDDAKEAFPYCVEDRNGREWEDLCNDCFDSLGCVIDLGEETTL